MFLKAKIRKLENWLESLTPMEVYYEVFVLGNLIVGVTSGIFLKFFYLALKFTDFKYLMAFYTIRILMYFWLVFYGGTSLILALKRSHEMVKWAAASIYGYVMISIACLYYFESFMPFQVLGGELFSCIYRLVKYGAC